MAWIYLAELEESPSRLSRGCEPSHIVKQTDTHRPFYCRECGLAILTEPLFGMMCKRCAVSSSKHPSILFMADSRVRISALLELEEAWKAAEADLCLNSLDSLASADLDSFSWKTSQLSLFGGLTAFSWTSMRSGMMRDGQLYQPQKWEPRTSENESGFLPTPTATPYGSNQGGAMGRIGQKRYSLEALWKMGRLPTPTVSQKSYDKQSDGSISHSLSGLWRATTGTTMPPSFEEWMMGYPIGATALDASVIPWFRSQRGKRSKDSQDSSKGEPDET